VIVVRNVYPIYIVVIITTLIASIYGLSWVGSSMWLMYRYPSWVFPALVALYIPLHEFSHYLFAKRYNSATKIKFFPKLFALAIDYVSLSFKEFLVVALAPQIFVGIPIIVLLLLTSSKEFAYLLVIHLVSSVGDYTSLILSIVHTTLYGKTMKIHVLYDNRGGIVGSVVESAKGNLYVYLVEELSFPQPSGLHRLGKAINIFINIVIIATLTVALVFTTSGILMLLAVTTKLKLFTHIVITNSSITINVNTLPLYLIMLPASLIVLQKIYLYTSRSLKILLISLLIFFTMLFVLYSLMSLLTMRTYRCSEFSLEFNLTSTVFRCK